MATVAKPIFPQVVKTGVAKITPAVTTTLQTLFTADEDGSRIDNIFVSSTDTSARDIQFVVTISAVDYVVGTLSIPATSGFVNSVPLVSVFAHSQFTALNSDLNGNKHLFLANGAVLKVKALVTLTASKEISVFAQCGDY